MTQTRFPQLRTLCPVNMPVAGGFPVQRARMQQHHVAVVIQGHVKPSFDGFLCCDPWYAFELTNMSYRWYETPQGSWDDTLCYWYWYFKHCCMCWKQCRCKHFANKMLITNFVYCFSQNGVSTDLHLIILRTIFDGSLVQIHTVKTIPKAISHAVAINTPFYQQKLEIKVQIIKYIYKKLFDTITNPFFTLSSGLAKMPLMVWAPVY